MKYLSPAWSARVASFVAVISVLCMVVVLYPQQLATGPGASGAPVPERSASGNHFVALSIEKDGDGEERSLDVSPPTIKPILISFFGLLFALLLLGERWGSRHRIALLIERRLPSFLHYSPPAPTPSSLEVFRL